MEPTVAALMLAVLVMPKLAETEIVPVTLPKLFAVLVSVVPVGTLTVAVLVYPPDPVTVA